MSKILTNLAVVVASSIGAPASAEVCSDLSMGSDFVTALETNVYNLFTDPNHNDPAIQSFFASPAIADCLREAEIDALFTEHSAESEALYQRIIDENMSAEQFGREVLGTEYDTATQLRKDLLNIRHKTILTIREQGLEVIPSDITEGSELAILQLISIKQAFQAWSTLLPEDDREDFLNWTTHSLPASDEVRRAHLEIIAANQDHPEFIRGQNLFKNADELDQMNAIDQRLDAERNYVQSVLERAEESEFTNFALIRGESHFDSQIPIQSLFPEESTSIFCLRSEFTNTERPEATCDYTINTTSLTITPQLP